MVVAARDRGAHSDLLEMPEFLEHRVAGVCRVASSGPREPIHQLVPNARLDERVDVSVPWDDGQTVRSGEAWAESAHAPYALAGRRCDGHEAEHWSFGLIASHVEYGGLVERWE